MLSFRVLVHFKDLIPPVRAPKMAMSEMPGENVPYGHFWLESNGSFFGTRGVYRGEAISGGTGDLGDVQRGPQQVPCRQGLK